VFSDFHVAALCNWSFPICSSYIEQVWPPLVYIISKQKFIVETGVARCGIEASLENCLQNKC